MEEAGLRGRHKSCPEEGLLAWFSFGHSVWDPGAEFQGSKHGYLSAGDMSALPRISHRKCWEGRFGCLASLERAIDTEFRPCPCLLLFPGNAAIRSHPARLALPTTENGVTEGACVPMLPLAILLPRLASKDILPDSEPQVC